MLSGFQCGHCRGNSRRQSCEVKVLHKTSLSTRGQVVIPVRIRNKLGLRPGTKFTVYDLDGKIVLIPELDDPVGHGLGFFNRKNAAQGE